MLQALQDNVGVSASKRPRPQKKEPSAIVSMRKECFATCKETKSTIDIISRDLDDELPSHLSALADMGFPAEMRGFYTAKAEAIRTLRGELADERDKLVR